MSDDRPRKENSGKKPPSGEGRTYQEWISVYETGTDYEADLVRDRLDDAGFPAVVLTQRDHAFNLNVGDLSAVHVMVPPEQAEEAREMLEGDAFTDEELDEAAMSADPDAPDAHDPSEEAMLDSGANIAGDEGTIDEPGTRSSKERERGDSGGEGAA